MTISRYKLLCQAENQLMETQFEPPGAPIEEYPNSASIRNFCIALQALTRKAAFPRRGHSKTKEIYVPCVVLTARIVKQKSSELGTFAARPTVTVGASSVRQDLGPKKDQSGGKA